MLGAFLAGIIFNLDYPELANPQKLENINVLKFLQVVQSIGFFIVPALIAGFLFEKNPGKYLKMNIKPNSSSLALVLILMIVIMPAINLFAEINIKIMDFLLPSDNLLKLMEEGTKETVEKFIKVDSIYGLVFNIFMIGILPALGEEMLFRGVGQRLLIDTFKNHHFGIIVAAMLFSIMHFEFYTFLPRFFMGLLFGYLFWWSGSLWLCIIPHFINNTVVVLVMYLIYKGNIPSDFENIGMDKTTIIYAVISIIISVFLIILIRKKEERVL
ncbi:MAG: hypothetical protein Kow0068_14390 [Marinilabiliales bacterium]